MGGNFLNYKTIIKLECVKKGITIDKFATEVIGVNSRQLMYYHLDKENSQMIDKVRKALCLT